MQLDLPFCTAQASGPDPGAPPADAPAGGRHPDALGGGSPIPVAPDPGDDGPPVTGTDVSPVFVRNRRARRYVLRVDPDGQVRVTIPRGGSRREADEFVARHASWITRQRARLTGSRIPAGDRRVLRQRARRELPPRLLALAARFGLAVARITIRDQRTRWGSCGRNGHICLNWRLIAVPDWVCEYVLVHELMHLRRLDHSPAYWKLVEAALPDYRSARRWLRQHGPSYR